VSVRREAHRRIRLDPVALHAKTALRELVRDAAIDEPHRDVLRRVGEEMQRDVIVRGGGAG
jgi:hypothetical protein